MSAKGWFANLASALKPGNRPAEIPSDARAFGVHNLKLGRCRCQMFRLEKCGCP